MKSGTTHNNFDEDAHFWLIEDRAGKCARCGKNHANCLHHIFGRGKKDDNAESSILNASPLNNFECHLAVHGQLMTEEWRIKLLNFTFNILKENNYKLKDKDKRFIAKYEPIIKKVLC